MGEALRASGTSTRNGLCGEQFEMSLLFGEVCMRILIESAVHIAAVIFCTSVIAAEISPNVAELPTGDVWPSDAAPLPAIPTHPASVA
jgi:hypothetical protein